MTLCVFVCLTGVVGTKGSLGEKFWEVRTKTRKSILKEMHRKQKIKKVSKVSHKSRTVPNYAESHRIGSIFKPHTMESNELWED